MVNVCDICGVVGYEEALATCSQCRIACQHCYCMQVFTFPEVPEVWVCEECVAGLDIVSQEDTQKNHISFKIQGRPTSAYNDLRRSRKEKAVKTGKVKFLSMEEVLKLSAGAEKESPSKLKCNVGRKTDSSVLPKPFLSRIKSNPRIVHQSPLRSPDCGKMKISEQPHRTSKEQNSPLSHAKENICKVKQMSPMKHANEIRTSKGNVPAKEVKNFSVAVEKSVHKASAVPSTSVYNLSIMGSNPSTIVKPKSSVAEESDLLSILPKLRLYRCVCPALDPIWNGGFEFSDNDLLDKFSSGFEARPPIRVHRKAYEFSKKMPKVIQIKLLPWYNVRDNLFENGYPCFADIALYFFPADNAQGSKENFSCLFGHMETQDSVMLSCIDGVELFVFTSKMLDADSHDAIAWSSMDHFLWGIFFDNRKNHIAHSMHKDPLSVSHSDGEHFHAANPGFNEVVDMDIDMVGGEDFGRVDMPVQKETSRRDCRESNKEMFNEDGLKDFGNMITRDSKKITTNVEQLLEEWNQSHPLQGGQKIDSYLATVTDRLPSLFGISPSSKDELGRPPGFEATPGMKTGGIVSKDAVREKKPHPISDNKLASMNKLLAGSLGLLSSANDEPDTSPDFEETRRLNAGDTVSEDTVRKEKPHSIAKSNFATVNTSFTGLLGKLAYAQAGFEETSRLRSRDILSEHRFGEEKPHPVALSVLSHIKTEQTCPQKVTGKQDDPLPSFPLKVKTETENLEVQHWMPPPEGWVKLNVAGIVKGCAGSAGAGGGGVMRNESGKWLLGFTLNLGTQKIIGAELWAIFNGLVLAWDKGFRKVVVESESCVAIEYIKRPPIDDPNRALIECCINLMKRDWKCKVDHVCKEANSCANWLAAQFQIYQMGLTLFDTAPADLVPILQNDSTRIALSNTCW